MGFKGLSSLTTPWSGQHNDSHPSTDAAQTCANGFNFNYPAVDTNSGPQGDWKPEYLHVFLSCGELIVPFSLPVKSEQTRLPLSLFSASSQRTWANLHGGGQKQKKQQHTATSRRFNVPLIHITLTLSHEPYQCARSRRLWWWWEGRSSSTRSRKPSLSLIFPPLTSSSVFLFLGDITVTWTRRFTLPTAPSASLSVCVCEWVSVRVWVSECARALGRATVRERLCVLSSAQSVTAGLYTAIFPLSHTHPLSPLWMTESGGLAGLSWLLFVVNIFKKASQWGRARACFWPIAESRSRWRGVRMRQWGWAF